MTLPRWYAIMRDFEQYPPVRFVVARAFGWKPPKELPAQAVHQEPAEFEE